MHRHDAGGAFADQLLVALREVAGAGRGGGGWFRRGLELLPELVGPELDPREVAVVSEPHRQRNDGDPFARREIGWDVSGGVRHDAYGHTEPFVSSNHPDLRKRVI